MKIYPMFLFHWFNRMRRIYTCVCICFACKRKHWMNESPDTHNIVRCVCVKEKTGWFHSDSTLFNKTVSPPFNRKPDESICRFVYFSQKKFSIVKTFDGYSSSYWKLCTARNIYFFRFIAKRTAAALTLRIYGILWVFAKAANHFMTTSLEQ